MNISQLPQGSYTPVTPQGMPPGGSQTPMAPSQPSQNGAPQGQPLNINTLPAGSYQPVQQPQGQSANPSVGGFISNAVSSAGNFISGIGQAVMHPIQTAENLGSAAEGGVEELGNVLGGGNGMKPTNDTNTQSWDNLVNFYKQRYGSPQAFLKTAYTDPIGFLSDASILADGIGGAADLAGVSDVAKAASTVGDLTNPAKAVTAPIDAAANSDFAGSIAKGAFSQVTGIQPNDIETIMKHPEEFTKSSIEGYDRTANATTINDALQSRITELGDTGSEYAPIRADVIPIPVEPDYLKNLIAKTTGLTVSGDGTGEFPYELEVNSDSKVRSATDAAKLQRQLMDKWNPQFAQGTLTPNQFLNLRSDLKDLAHYEGGIGKSADLESAAKTMRSTLNNDFRPKIQGLAETDAKYSSQVQKLNELKNGLLDKNSELKPTAVNRIANALGKGKDAYLSQLEEISPGITKDIAVGKAKEAIQSLKGNVVGTYGRTAGTIAAAGAGLTGGPLGAVLSAVIEHIISSPEVAVPLLRSLGKGTPLYNAILAHFNVSTPALITSQIGKMSKATQTPAPRVIKVRVPR